MQKKQTESLIVAKPAKPYVKPKSPLTVRSPSTH
jgi:hypothetical protein